MEPKKSLTSRISSILFWSIISAAFIGPGTVTTTSLAGASYQYALLWALTFATIATIFLQEAAARVTLASGLSLGEAISMRYSSGNSKFIKLFIASAILLGGAAYQAGNVLGAVSGLSLMLTINPKLLTIILIALAGFFLWIGNTTSISKVLGLIVAMMGFVFIVVAFSIQHNGTAIVKSLVLPSIPEGADLLVIGLIGTTIVPYNLFLASGISKGQSIQEMRFGITTAVAIGGIISMAILLVGTQVSGEFSFANLAGTLENNLGKWSGLLFGIGLFAAGFTSSVTAPFASSLTVQSIYGANDKSWSISSKKFRSIWIITLLIGLIFGLSGVKPIPVIVAAQALGGILLPFITIFLFLIVNDPKTLPKEYLNKGITNIVMLFIIGLTTFLGLNNVFKAINAASGLDLPFENIFIWLIIISVLIAVLLAFKVYRARK
ncbi:divalent metal cation transporter [Fulvivirgaceae bacterium BMA10]|uniref:Divalent metal cation transporter n=1 Tax=Splendidivirga corallicola TaxID=3051826 RepID=A0ABT8KXZ8_9BACT|nr:divalent metal cation transporter [Fulvivirgaceae bacterium BMA10]